MKLSNPPRLRWFAAIVLATEIGGLLAVTEACSPAANRAAANTALDVATATCIVLNATLDEQSIKTVCNVADELMPDVRKLIATQRQAVAFESARAKLACLVGDAGRP